MAALAFVLTGAPAAVAADVLTVCRTLCDHDTIQAAIDVAQPGDTIRVGAGVYRESIRIDTDLRLEGEDASSTILDGEGPTTVVVVEAGATVTIAAVTITNGVGSSGGTTNDAGGIHNLGTLKLIGSIVRGNVAPEDAGGRGKGGGIRNDGDLTVVGGFIGGNLAAGRGGGVYNTGTLSLDGVTLCDNAGSFGGGVFNEGEATLARSLLFANRASSDGGGVQNENRCLFSNCTLSRNEADRDGGAIWVGGTEVGLTRTELVHCTLFDNETSRGEGAGIFNDRFNPVELTATIVAGNDGGRDCAGPILSHGYSIDSDDSCGLDAAGERPDLPEADPRLSQLGHHGGPTLTHALLPGSPAIDAAGVECAVATDQRHGSRPVGERCDIGAYERPLCVAQITARFRRGDANGDGSLDISDAAFLLLYLFVGEVALTCEDAGDANDDGEVVLSDPIFTLNWLFRGGPSPPAPLSCGPDPTADDLDCASVRHCDDPDPGPDGAGAGGVAGPRPYRDLWTSAAELERRAMSGEAWEAVLAAARDACAGEATVTNQDSNNNVQILAAAIASARLAAVDRSTARVFRDKVVLALEKLVEEGDPVEAHGCPFGCGKAVNETLAWGREAGAYVLAADLVDYRTAAFERWVRDMAENYVACDGRTMLESFQRRPNNWGVMLFGSLVAMYAYLGDEEALMAIRDYFVRGLTGDVPDCASVPEGEPCYVWGGSIDPREKDMTWHCDPMKPTLIAPPCRVALPDGTSVDLDGLIPDDQRRACSFCPPGSMSGFCATVSADQRCSRPGADAHITDWMNGAVMGARVLDRIGLGIWDTADRAFRRMILAHLVAHCQVTCEDPGFLCESLYNCKDWVIPILDEAYDLQSELTPPPRTACDCPVVIAGRGTGASKNAGFGAYVAP